jgi:hypothetical protein
MPYTAEKLALLLVLRDQVDSKKKVQASSRVGEASLMNDLKRAFRELFAAYSTSLELYLVMKRSEAGKSIRLPSLDRQLIGTLVQYKFRG